MKALAVVAIAMSLILAMSVMIGMRGGFWKRWHVYLVTTSYVLICATLLFGVEVSSLPDPWLTVVTTAFLIKSFALVALLIDQHASRFDDVEWGYFHDGRGNSITRRPGVSCGSGHHDRMADLAHKLRPVDATKASG